MRAEAKSQSRLTDMLLGPYQALRGNRNLAVLFGGQVISKFGDWLYLVALVVLVYDLTQSATIVAALTFVRLLPFALFSLVAGVVVDRWNRKRVLIVTDLGRAACMLGLMLVRSPESLWLAFPFCFITAALASFSWPAMSSVLPGIARDADELVQANTLLSQINALALVLGPALGGVLVLLGQPQTAFLINGITFLVSAITLLFVHVPAHPHQAGSAESHGQGAITAGFKFLFRDNEGTLGAFTAVAAAKALLLGAMWSLSVVFAEETFELGSQGTGFLNAAYGTGGLAGGFMAGMIINRLRVCPAFTWGAAASGVVAGLVAVGPAGALPFVGLALLGATHVFLEIIETTIVQTATPTKLLGRVVGAYESVVIVAILVGSLIAGPLIDTFGPRIAMIVFALIQLGLLLGCLPYLRRLEAVLGVRIFLRQVPLFAKLSDRLVNDLASRLQSGYISDGTQIVREGEAGDRLYIIKSGQVDVVARDEAGRDVVVETLSRADYFGEIALLRRVPRTATVLAHGPVELYSLHHADFEELLRRSAEVKTEMTATSEARYANMRMLLLARV